jgi:hypothetical protein
MRRDVGAILFVAALMAACSGGSQTPTSPSNTQLAGSTGGGGSTQSNNNEVDLKGRVDALPPSTPAGTFTTAGKTIVTNSSTVFVSGTTTESFANLRVGVEVEVHGTASGNAVTATRVEIEDEAEPEPEPEPHNPPSPNPPAPNPPAPNPPAPTPPREAELSGTIAGLTGTASSFQFTLGGTLVKGDPATMIAGDSSVPKTFADLKNGAVVEVHGTQQTGFVQALRIQVEGPENEPPDDNENEVDVRGALGPITGTCPAISSTVGTTKFATTASTRFDDVACNALKAGANVRVRGTRSADGSISATRLQKD